MNQICKLKNVFTIEFATILIIPVIIKSTSNFMAHILIWFFVHSKNTMVQLNNVGMVNQDIVSNGHHIDMIQKRFTIGFVIPQRERYILVFLIIGIGRRVHDGHFGHQKHE